MPIDPNIILGIKQPQLESPLDAAAKVMTMKHLAMQNQVSDRDFADNQAMRDAFKNNMQVGSNGTPTLNRQGVMSDLTKGGLGQKAMDLYKLFQTQDLDEIKAHTAAAKDLSWSATPENWNYIRQKASSLGLPNADKLPDQYDDSFVKSWQQHTLNGEEQIKKMESEREFNRKRDESTRDQGNKDRDFGQKERELDAKRGEVGIKREQLILDKDDKAAKDLDKHLSQGWAGRSGQAGSVQGKINAAEAAEQLIAQGQTQKGGLDSRQMEELAQSTARLLGGSAAASARIEALVPKTWYGSAQSLKEWLTNNPTGQGQEEFVKRMAETVTREKALAVNQMRQFQVEGLAAHSGLKQRNPTLYNSILESKGINPSMVDQKGRYKAPTDEGNTKEWNGVTYKKIGNNWVAQ